MFIIFDGYIVLVSCCLELDNLDSSGSWGMDQEAGGSPDKGVFLKTEVLKVPYYYLETPTANANCLR
jgi:hypothetical protein